MKKFLLGALAALPLFALCLTAEGAQDEGKVLIYYFQNLTGDRSYDDLTYLITLCLYRSLEREERFLIIEPPERQGRAANQGNLWDTDYMNAVATGKRITRVLFGYFYLDEGKLVAKPRVYYLESGLILDLTPKQADMYGAVTELQDMSAAQVRQCAPPVEDTAREARKQKEVVRSRRKPPSNGDEPAPFRTMIWSLGPAVTTSDWSSLYFSGLRGVISYMVYPKGRDSRLAFGFQTGFTMFSREAGVYAQSNTVILPAGVAVQYALLKCRKGDRLLGYGVVGMAFSALSMSGHRIESLDLYSGAGLGVNLLYWDQGSLYGGVSVQSVNYQDAAMNMVTGELGIRFIQ